MWLGKEDAVLVLILAARPIRLNLYPRGGMGTVGGGETYSPYLHHGIRTYPHLRPYSSFLIVSFLGSFLSSSFFS